MAYSVQADVENRAGGAKKLIELADWDNDSVADAARITSAIADADALIDSFAAKLFHVPFNPVPAIIKQFSSELARIVLARDRNMLTQDMQMRWEEIAGTDEKKPGWLLQLARGVVTPGTDPMPTKHGTMVVDTVETELPSERDIAREKLAGWW